jgi:hypothetical protein
MYSFLNEKKCPYFEILETIARCQIQCRNKIFKVFNLTLTRVNKPTKQTLNISKDNNTMFGWDSIGDGM